jgi:polyphosphate kinase 2 (PPK2 family)
MILEQVDLSQKISQAAYERELEVLQKRLKALGYEIFVQQRAVVMCFEGWDAAGKGGTIKRITEALDPRMYTVWPIAAPEGEDKTHHYLYRFWRRLLPRGNIAAFDRSWYGRVLVERVEGFCTEEAWKRAYREINEFERQLVEFDMIIFKFWLHISQEEELRRFQEREATPYKAWKLTADDWRNRAKWDLYYAAVDEMLLQTSTAIAPWTVVPSEDKHFGRIFTLRTIVDKLEKELGMVGREGKSKAHSM